MKRWIYLALPLLLLTSGCATLRNGSAPAREIVVETPYSPREAFSRVGRELDRRHYQFEEIDRMFGAIRTRPRRLNDSVRVQIAVDVLTPGPAGIRLWGWYRTGGNAYRITQTDQQGTAAYDAWRELSDIARWMPGTTRYR